MTSVSKMSERAVEERCYDIAEDKKGDRFRNWMFTVNNYTTEDMVKLDNLNDRVKIKYLIYGKEIGKEGTPHLQGFICFKDAKTWKVVHKYLPSWWCHYTNSSADANIKYCSKDGDFKEFGERPKGQGARSDISTVKEMISEGKRMEDVVEEVDSYQAIRFAETYLKYKEIKRTWLPEVYWFYGNTGTGKTREAFKMYPDAWVSGESGKWFDGYDGHEAVIFDDFRADFCKFHTLLRLLDRYAYRIECKGGSRQFLAKVIIITCPKRPESVYQGRTNEDLKQLLRRIKEVRRFGPPTDEDAADKVIRAQTQNTQVACNNRWPPVFDPKDTLTEKRDGFDLLDPDYKLDLEELLDF